jgi:HKD family nuclease
MLVTNNNNSHKNLLIKLFQESDEIIFAVGFFKRSGLINIEHELKSFVSGNKKSTFFIGTGLGETDPQSLLELHSIIQNRKNHKLIICTPDAGIFHPKIYLFRRNNNITIIVGSANLTEAGWIINDEVSTITNTTTESTDFVEINDYFDGLIKRYYVDDVKSYIEEYKRQLDEFNATNSRKPIFRFRKVKTRIEEIDLPRLIGFYKKYKESNWFNNPIEREEKYIEAREKLNELASRKKLNSKQFHDLFGPLVGHANYKKLWHSGNIHRTTYKTLKYADAFRDLVREIKSNIDKPTETAFGDSINYLNEKRKAKEITGIGENILAEMLMSYDYQKFANLNKNPIAVFALIGKQFKSPGSFRGYDYAEYVELLNKIRKTLKMRSFLEIDSFFNYVYWNLKEE